ncbi:hypothetical protein CVS40_9056 [Lucilia cuprina]|nr:hypothetical protein CVS40_9056 [Lucilia cuprina]
MRQVEELISKVEQMKGHYEKFRQRSKYSDKNGQKSKVTPVRKEPSVNNNQINKNSSRVLPKLYLYGILPRYHL